MARAFNTGLPVSARRLPPHRTAFLNAIAGGESGGRYNVRYTPKKEGATFSDFSRHPGIREPGPHGPSSAAGRYQFVETTWNRLGGGPFTPERQDEMAWKLAVQDYRSRTGRDLEQDLLSEGFSPRIQKALTPTWQALKGDRSRHTATYQQTLADVLGGKAPEFDSAVTTATHDGLDDIGDSSMALRPTPTIQPQNRSQLMAIVLEQMKENAKQPNPKSWAETGVRALTQGLQGRMAKQALEGESQQEAQRRQWTADFLENPQVAQALEAGVLQPDDLSGVMMERMGLASRDQKRATASNLVQVPGPDGNPVWVWADEAVGSPAYEKPEKPSSRDQQVEMLEQTGVPRDVAQGIAAGRFVTSRDPINGTVQVVDKATGRIVFDGARAPGSADQGPGMGPAPDQQMGQIGQPTQQPGQAQQGAPSFIPENVDPTEATGLSGVVGGAINRVADLFGQGLPFPEVDEATEALKTTQVLTRALLQEAVPGRPSAILLAQLGELTVEPASLFRGDERARTRLRQTRDLLQEEVNRIEREVLARPGQFRPQELTASRLNASELSRLLRAYDAMLGTLERRRGEGRPPLEQFHRSR